MFRWIPYAFVRIVVFFAAGIVVALFFPRLLPVIFSSVLFLLLVVLFAAALISRRAPRTLCGAVGLAAIFLAGYVNTQLHALAQLFEHRRLTYEASCYKARAVSPAVERSRTWRQEVEIDAVLRDGAWTRADGKVLLYIDRRADERPFSYGDIIVVRGGPIPFSPPSNPGEFDYRNFMLRQSFVGKQYLRDGDAVKTGASPNPLLTWAYALRERAHYVLTEHINDERARAIASALLLGIRDDLDEGIKDAYAGTGAMHVLAVSGLHVGIIYGLLLMVGKRWRRKKYGKWVVFILSLLVLWTYAAVTGFSPSVLRAATMFSFFTMALPLRRRTNTYNLWAVSAWCTLLIDPFQIVMVGFQLSYLAVLGIVALQPVLYRLYEARSALGDYVWKLTSVSLAAQCTTFPLGLLYFHQFPGLFLLSNLVVIPGAAVIVVVGLALQIVSWVGPLADVVGWSLEGVIKLMNTAIFALDNLPFSRLDHVFITPLECILIFCFVASIVFMLMLRRARYLRVAFACMLLLSASTWYRLQTLVLPDAVTIYNIPGYSMIDFFSGGNGFTYFDPKETPDPGTLEYYATTNRISRGVAHVASCQSFSRSVSGGTLICWRGTTFLVLQKAVTIPDDLKIDYLVIGRDAVGALEYLTQNTNVAAIILDSSVSRRIAEGVLSQYAHHLNIYSVAREGARTLKLSQT